MSSLRTEIKSLKKEIDRTNKDNENLKSELEDV